MGNMEKRRKNKIVVANVIIYVVVIRGEEMELFERGLGGTVVICSLRWGAEPEHRRPAGGVADVGERYTLSLHFLYIYTVQLVRMQLGRLKGSTLSP